MKIFKRLCLCAVGLVAALLVGSLFLPESVRVTRTASAKASPENVFAQLNIMKNWENWSPWYEKDPKTTLRYEGPAEGKGAKYSWDSPSQGKGSLTIVESVPNKKVRTDLEFVDHGKGVAEHQLEKEGSGTKIIWMMEMQLGKNPVAKYFGLLMDKMIGPDFEKGLQNLARVAESASDPAPAPATKEAAAK